MSGPAPSLPIRRDGAATPHPGPALRRLRRLRGMKQSHLAELVGVSQGTVSRWERGLLPLSAAQEAAVERRLAAGPAGDAALRRLVESSAAKVHLICDRTHRLLAASPARRAEWRLDIAELLGRPLIAYASPEILAAEATLAERGWHEDRLACLALDTGANGDALLPIPPGRVLWERILLADGSAGRLVTAIA
ncbi:helix-turn-helix transcriptional regulator [Labrys wisconsinensis]|uniref:Transcriptional regulator with XRE-family HTH domain n=1 Tax=Labrys wisconsinensis TaxID=425677 RepID=A0ABU0J8S9_9HYPH|nr:helix-turn-helix transcriptional regulator [Labrys wisconsinensis]MDQ0470677.1 transcriptional regulator with XRE-family HTH domain [Labrys wisconsinensis]